MARRHTLKRETLPSLTQLFNLVRILHDHMDDLESMWLGHSTPLFSFLRGVPHLLPASFHVSRCRSLHLWKLYLNHVATEFDPMSLMSQVLRVMGRCRTSDRPLSSPTWTTTLKRITDYVNVAEWGLENNNKTKVGQIIFKLEGYSIPHGSSLTFSHTSHHHHVHQKKKIASEKSQVHRTRLLPSSQVFFCFFCKYANLKQTSA